MDDALDKKNAVSTQVQDLAAKDFWESKLDDFTRSGNTTKRSKYELIERKSEWNASRLNNGVIPGDRSFGKNKHIRGIKLPDLRYTNEMFEMVTKNPGGIALVYPLLRDELTFQNYVDKFQFLIQLEEIENDLNLHIYDQDRSTFRRSGMFFELQVSGLAEGRPSIQIGDSILARPFPSGKRVYQGCIHKVKQESILLKFNSEFHTNYNGEQYDISFNTSRTSIRRCHFGVIQAAKLLDEKTLFPHTILFRNARDAGTNIRWFNKGLNERQKKAVVGVLRGECRPCPYMIFGPPGTGKTVTIVEAILQIWKRDPKTRILACAGSNSCADNITEKLLETGVVGRVDMVRIVAFNRIDFIPSSLTDYYSECKEDNVQNWLNHRIIISTCSNAGAIIQFLPMHATNHFTHVLIDEAATVTEPESMLAFLMAAQSGGITVLVGDPFQLGPILQSKTAAQCGLGRSMMSRLFEITAYLRNSRLKEHGGYDERCVTKLIESYRCCNELILVNNRLFYHSELIGKLQPDKKLMASLGISFPIVFVGVEGQDLQEPDSPSWLNPKEVIEVVKIYSRITVEIGIDQIGIITPYRKQAEKIRSFMRAIEREVCKVSTIEDFQGQERDIIILSLVRSKELHMTHDMRFNLGFLFNEKRFNVATSRAKKVLFIVGNPRVLSKDNCWKQVIKYCMLNESYVDPDGGRFVLNEDDD
jgi:hypothetical protein